MANYLEIQDWMKSLTIPRKELSGFAICPYAKQVLQNKEYEIFSCNVENIHDVIKKIKFNKSQVVIIVVQDYYLYSIELMYENTVYLNEIYNSQDIVILDNDPRQPFIINGVTTTFSKSYLWLIQSLSDLNQKHEILSKSNYYSVWTKKQLDEVVSWRNK